MTACIRVRVEGVVRSVLEGAANGSRVRLPTLILPFRIERTFLLVEYVVVIFASRNEPGSARVGTYTQLSYHHRAHQSIRSIVDEAAEIARRFTVVPLLGTDIADETVLEPVPIVVNGLNLERRCSPVCSLVG